MKLLLFIIFCVAPFIGKTQNGFTTYTTNLIVTGAIKFQRDFLVDHNGNKWLGFWTMSSATNALGLIKYEKATNSWILFNRSSTPALPSTMINALKEDANGNIWIGCDSGLVKYDGALFTRYTILNGLPSQLVKSIETSGNNIIIGTNNGLSIFNGSTFTNYSVSNGTLPNDTITCIKKESNNVLWLGCGANRLLSFNINGSLSNTSFVVYPLSGYPGRINCIHIDQQNTKWLGTTNSGLLLFSGTNFMNAQKAYSFPGLIPDKVVDLSEGLHNGVVVKYELDPYVSFSRYGLIELAPNGQVYNYIKSPNTFTTSIADYIEKDGNSIVFSYAGYGTSYTAPMMFGSFSDSLYVQPLGTISDKNATSLDINKVKANITNSGSMHGFYYNNSGYEVPRGSGNHTSTGSSLWIGGKNASNQLHAGAQMYSFDGNNAFWPGPLDTITGTTDSVTAINYNKVWKLTYTEINDFISNFNAGNVQNGTYLIPENILTWPAHGLGNNSRTLAPFVDVNGDGIYNPPSGDYPKIKGDQAIYYIYNDVLITSLTPMGIEVQVMAYAYGCPGVLNGKNELAYTTFYDYKIINRSSNNYHDVFVGLWSDAKIGIEEDDVIGCNVSENYGYVYNFDSLDNNVKMGGSDYKNYPPAQGTVILKGPTANLSDGVDNNNNGAIDEANEDCKMSKFISIYEGESVAPSPMAWPNNKWDYYNFMNGRWKDTAIITCWSNGYGATINTNWLYPGDPNSPNSTDPNNTCGNWIDNYYSGGTNFIIGSGPFTLNAGQMKEIEYAFVTSFDSSSTTNSNLLSVAKLKTDIQKVRTFYNQVNKLNCLQSINIGVEEVLKKSDFNVYPNPTRSIVNVTSTIEGKVKIGYELLDVLGKTIIKNESYNNSFLINIENVNSGIYFLKLDVNGSVVVKKIVKE